MKLGGSGSRQGGKAKWVIVAIVLLGGGFFGYHQFTGVMLTRGDKALAAGDYQAAKAAYGRVAGLPFSGGRGKDGLGVIALLEHRVEEAKTHFKALTHRKPGGRGASPEVVLDTFIGQGRYESGLIYKDFLLSWRGDSSLSELHLPLAALSLGARDLDAARDHLGKVSESKRDSERFARVKDRVEQAARDGYLPLVRDRRGDVLLVHDLEKQTRTFQHPELFVGWGADGAALLDAIEEHDRHNVVETTIDLNLQRAAFQAMQGYQGTMVLMEPAGGEVLAAYGTEGYNPFTRDFEPGSVIKVVTYGAFLNENGDPSAYAPKDYPSFEVIGGKTLYDWTPQGRLQSIEEGMAVSCNLMFANMGIDVGWPKLSEAFQTFFDGKPRGVTATPGTFGKLAKIPNGVYEVGRSAIGLDFIAATSYGLAAIPATIGAGGLMSEPKLIQGFANVEGVRYREVESPEPQRVYSQVNAAKLLDSLRASVAFERGTARRAEVDFVETAMKTGTAGDRPFDSIMIGLFPADDPRLAFAFFLHKGGKCEINGARVAKRLLEQIRALAPSYLE